MFRIPAFAALCLAAVPAFAQNQTTPAPAAPAGPPPEVVNAIQQAGMAFGQCVQTGASAVPATVTPEAGATSVLAGCATQRQALDRAAAALLAALPEATAADGAAQIQPSSTGVEAQVAAGIRAARTAPTIRPGAPAVRIRPCPASSGIAATLRLKVAQSSSTPRDCANAASATSLKARASSAPYSPDPQPPALSPSSPRACRPPGAPPCGRSPRRPAPAARCG